jgi:hypothetical protein
MEELCGGRLVGRVRATQIVSASQLTRASATNHVSSTPANPARWTGPPFHMRRDSLGRRPDKTRDRERAERQKALLKRVVPGL